MNGSVIRTHAGWRGAFTRDQVRGALTNGSRVEKVKTEKGDSHAIGARATVIGSVRHPQLGIAYFVEWDAHPRCAVFTTAKKIAALAAGAGS